MHFVKLFILAENLTFTEKQSFKISQLEITLVKNS